MNHSESMAFEIRIMGTLDRCMLKMADALDNSFQPDDENAVKLLNAFRSLMSIRRIWAKEYGLVLVPDALSLPAGKNNAVSKPQNGGKTDSSHFTLDPMLKKVMDTVAKNRLPEVPQPKKEEKPVINGLLAR